jgi:type IV secretory pathway VirB4 component
VIADTQNFSQLRDSPIYSTFLSTIATKIILPNSNVQSGLIKSVLQDFGVNDHQLALIEKGKPFRDYIVINDYTTRVLASTFDKREMTMLTSEKTDNQLLTKLMTENPSDFRSIYVKTKIGA